MSQDTYTIYIDEAGDLGIGRGSRWFILTGVIVNNSKETELLNLVRAVKTDFGLKEIHFNKITGFYKEMAIVSRLSEGNYLTVNVVVDTQQITITPTYGGDIYSLTYNTACRYLLERYSWFLRSKGAVGTVVLSSRGSSRDGDLISYIKSKLIPNSSNSVSSRITSVSAFPAKSRNLLQLADVCASSIYHAYEPNKYGQICPCFASQLSKHLVTYNGSLMGYGLKYYAVCMKPPIEYFKSMSICPIKKDESPERT